MYKLFYENEHLLNKLHNMHGHNNHLSESSINEIVKRLQRRFSVDEQK